jgi:hypothetical protein
LWPGLSTKKDEGFFFLRQASRDHLGIGARRLEGGSYHLEKLVTLPFHHCPDGIDLMRAGILSHDFLLPSVARTKGNVVTGWTAATLLTQ